MPLPPVPVVDFVIATHNRSALLTRTLTSFTAMHVPDDWSFRVTVVANNCSDDTTDVVARLAHDSRFAVQCRVEPVPGKSAALNTGVATCTAEWIAFIDDDELICSDWLTAFVDAQARLRFDFAGGQYLPDYEQAPPPWIPPRHVAPVLACHAEDVREVRVRAEDSLVWGGNFVVRRDALLDTGPFDVDFARHASLMALGCEDADMVRRLLARGYEGWFLPSMRIRHWVPQERLTRTYFRRKILGHGYNARRYERMRMESQHQGPLLLGLPRWRWRGVVRSMIYWTGGALRRAPHEAFGHELDLWSFAGYWKAVRDGH